MSVLLPLVVGIAFGALLERGGLTRHERIVGVFRLRDFTVLKFLLTAIVAGAALGQAAVSLGLAAALPVTGNHLAANAAGGALFGVGMAVAGFCPGTIVAGAGTGRLDALLPGLLGLAAGALAFGFLQASFQPALASVAALGPVTLPSLLGASPWLVILLLAEVSLLAFYFIERG